MSICVILFGCKDDPVPVLKQQKVIFEVSTVKCNADPFACIIFTYESNQKCAEMSTKLSGEISSGWRVVTSTSKVKQVTSLAGFSCEGTEYVIEK
jgi:hypothetical protein